MAPANLLEHSTPDTQRWPGPARIDDAVETFRCTAEGRQWQRTHFAEALRMLANDTQPDALLQARRQLETKAPPPIGLESAAYPELLTAFLQEMALGVAQRRMYIPRLVVMQQPRAPLFDQRISLVLPLLAEFELALQDVEAQLRTLFVEELRSMGPSGKRQLAHLA